VVAQTSSLAQFGKDGSCYKCGGTGYLPEFRHVMGGVCFACGFTK